MVVSGTGDRRFTRHTIEDHLLAAAEEPGKHQLQSSVDPKEEWRQIPKEKQQEILATLARNPSLAEKHFKQHIKALRHAIHSQQATTQ